MSDREENPATQAALDDAIIAVAGRVVAGAELDPESISSLGYAAWCLAAARDNLTAKTRSIADGNDPTP